MVVNLRICWEQIRASLSQLLDCLLGFYVNGNQPVRDGSEVARYLSDIEGKRQALADEYEESGVIGSGKLPHVPCGNRTISYWSDSGHFWQFRYSEKTIMDTDHHVNNLADDPTIPFSHDDAMRCQKMMQIMETTMDCRDVVGF
jgi:hypothetical protein